MIPISEKELQMKRDRRLLLEILGNSHSMGIVWLKLNIKTLLLMCFTFSDCIASHLAH